MKRTMSLPVAVLMCHVGLLAQAVEPANPQVNNKVRSILNYLDQLPTRTNNVLFEGGAGEGRWRSFDCDDLMKRDKVIFGLTSNDPLPEVDEETQETYHKYLSENLVFPFEATFQPEHGSPLRITVTGLSDPDEEPDYIDETYGLLCDARIGRRQMVVPLGELEVPRGKPNRQLISDYTSWLWS